MSRLIDFKFPCPACRTQSSQTAPKPTALTPTTGWLKCPECLCQILTQLTLNTTKRLEDGRPSLQIAALKIKPSKRYLDKIHEQRERKAREAAELKQRVDDEGVVVLPPPPELKV